MAERFKGKRNAFTVFDNLEDAHNVFRMCTYVTLQMLGLIFKWSFMLSDCRKLSSQISYYERFGQKVIFCTRRANSLMLFQCHVHNNVYNKLELTGVLR